jgi:hypothetical protein
LQQSFGNQAVGRMVQAKLNINQPGDEYEREADRVADTVMRMPAPQSDGHRLAVTPLTSHQAQRQCAECEEKEEEGALQRKEGGSAATAPSTTPPIVHDVLSSTGRPLDAAVGNFMESRFGRGFSQVRIHTDSKAAESAKALNARAYTVGTEVIFGANQYSPDTTEGKRLLAHELTHTLQQNGASYQVQRDLLSCEQGEECPERETGEGTWAIGDGIHAEFVLSPAIGFLVWGFPINSSSAAGIESQPDWAPFLSNLIANANVWKVRGFSDCIGDEVSNTSLREKRAAAARAALPKDAQAKVSAPLAAPLEQCISSNTSKEGRSRNRAAFFQSLSMKFDFDDPSLQAPPGCSPRGARETASNCTPNPEGRLYPSVGGTHTESHAFEPCLLSELEVAASPDWCVDAQQAHGGEVCYRQIPKASGDPGDQYCYSENCCHNSHDEASVVDPSSPGAGSCCRTNPFNLIDHVKKDVVPELKDDPCRVTEDITGVVPPGCK